MSFGNIMSGLRLGEDPENEESKPADNVYRIALLLNSLICIVYLIEIPVLALFSSSFGNLSLLSWELSPDFAKILVFLAIILGFLVNPLGVIGLLRSSRTWVSAFFYSAFLLVAVTMVTFVFLLMSGNGTVVVGNRSVNSNDFDKGTVLINTFADETQEKFVEFGVNFPNEWRLVQEELSCCGLNLQTVYVEQQFDVEGASLDTVNSGRNCQSAANDISDLFEDFPEFNEAASIAADQKTFLGLQNFFCEQPLSVEVKSRAQNFSVLFGVQVFAELILMFLQGLLIFSYQEKDGGLRANEEDMAARPKIENTVLVKAGYNPRQLGLASTMSGPGSRSTPGHQKVKF